VWGLADIEPQAAPAAQQWETSTQRPAVRLSHSNIFLTGMHFPIDSLYVDAYYSYREPIGGLQ